MIGSRSVTLMVASLDAFLNDLLLLLSVRDPSFLGFVKLFLSALVTFGVEPLTSDSSSLTRCRRWHRPDEGFTSEFSLDDR